jgi:hypothetical protein
VTCAEVVIRTATILRLTKSGAMAQMRRALANCPDAGRRRAEDDHESADHRLAREMLVALARGER